MAKLIHKMKTYEFYIFSMFFFHNQSHCAPVPSIVISTLQIVPWINSCERDFINSGYEEDINEEKLIYKDNYADVISCSSVCFISSLEVVQW